MITKSLQNKVWALIKKGNYKYPSKKEVKSFIRENKIKYKYFQAVYGNLILNKWILSQKPKHLNYNGNLLDLSVKHDIPPYMLYQILKKKYQISKREEEIAIKHDDFFNPQKTKMSQIKSKKFEENVAKKLIGLKYKTEEDLKGSPLTPDFLLTEPFIYNNKTMHWIDAKNFYGSDLPFTYKMLRKQADKYNKAFGSGMFVFRYSFCETLQIPDTELISYKDFVI